MPESVGSKKFRAIPGTGGAKAERLGVAAGTISKWENGKMAPDEAKRLEISKAFGIAPEEWGDVSGLAQRAALPPLEPATPAAVVSEAELMLQSLKQLRAEAAEIADVAERARVLADAARSLLVLGKLTGVGLNLTQAQIIASPAWRLLEDMITLALEPWPEAMLAVADMIQGARTPEAVKAPRTE